VQASTWRSPLKCRSSSLSLLSAFRLFLLSFVLLFRLLLLLVLLHLFLVSFSFLLFDRNCVIYRSGGADGPAVVVTFMMLMMLMRILTIIMLLVHCCCFAFDIV
jgi:hypothetical protein